MDIVLSFSTTFIADYSLFVKTGDDYETSRGFNECYVRNSVTIRIIEMNNIFIKELYYYLGYYILISLGYS